MQDHVFERHCSAYKHLQNNVEVSPLYLTDVLLDTGDDVNSQFGNNKDSTQTIRNKNANKNNNDDDYFMINIDDDFIIEQSLPTLNSNERQDTGRQELEQPLSCRELPAMVNNQF